MNRTNLIRSVAALTMVVAAPVARADAAGGISSAGWLSILGVLAIVGVFFVIHRKLD